MGEHKYHDERIALERSINITKQSCISKSKKPIRTKCYPCPDCSRSFNCRSNMTKHYRTIHLNVITGQCHICQRKFRQNSSLTRHIKIVHKKETPFSCDICHTRFSLEASLKKHKDAVHLKSLNYACNFCGYKTSRADTLRVHVRKIHTKEWKYECTICKDKGLTWGCILPKELRRHVRTRHSDQVIFNESSVDQTPQLTTSDAAASDRLSIVLTATPRYVEHSTDGGVDCIKSLKQIADSLIDKIKEPVEYSRQLEAEVQAKACRVPQRIIAPLFASLNHLNTVRDLAVTEDRGQPQAGVKAGEARPANADLSRLDCNDQAQKFWTGMESTKIV